MDGIDPHERTDFPHDGTDTSHEEIVGADNGADPAASVPRARSMR